MTRGGGNETDVDTRGFGSDCGVATSRAATAVENEIRFEGVRMVEFNAGPIRAIQTRRSEKKFVEAAESKKGNDWDPMFTFRFIRAQSRRTLLMLRMQTPLRRRLTACLGLDTGRKTPALQRVLRDESARRW